MTKGRWFKSSARTEIAPFETKTKRLGDIKERELNSLIGGLEFPDKPLIIPCSIQGKNLGSSRRSYAK